MTKHDKATVAGDKLIAVVAPRRETLISQAKRQPFVALEEGFRRVLCAGSVPLGTHFN
jgi:hypothetical protein